MRTILLSFDIPFTPLQFGIGYAVDTTFFVHMLIASLIVFPGVYLWVFPYGLVYWLQEKLYSVAPEHGELIDDEVLRFALLVAWISGISVEIQQGIWYTYNKANFFGLLDMTAIILASTLTFIITSRITRGK